MLESTLVPVLRLNHQAEGLSYNGPLETQQRRTILKQLVTLSRRCLCSFGGVPALSSLRTI